MTTLDRQRPSAVAAPAPPQAPRQDHSVGLGADTEPGIGEVLTRLHHLMRGRYLVSATLALLCAAAFGYGGYRLGERTYRSSGLIRIVPTLPRIMYETEDKGVMPMFDSFVQTQVSLIRTQRVQELALEDRAWPTPPARDSEAVDRFGKKLIVTRDNELIAITFDDANPDFAQNAVKSVISAYHRLFVEADVRENDQLLNRLVTKQTALNNDLVANRTRTRAIAQQYGTDNIDGFFKGQLEIVQALEQQVGALNLKQKAAESAATGQKLLTPELLSLEDPMMRELLQQRSRAQYELRTLTTSFSENHVNVKSARNQLAVLDGEIKDRQEALSGKGGNPERQANVSQELDAAKASLAEAKKQLATIGQEQFQLADLKREADGINELLAQTKSRLEQLNTEAPVATGRITVESPGDRPLVPSRDTRRTFSAAAGSVGFVLPFGLALLMGLTSRRYGAPVETRMSAITRDLVLGALPSIDEGEFDPEASQLAAHCLHQVRTMLQIRCNGHAKSIAVTSSIAGSGKTSVVLGLGISYAMAGSRTLLIDLDLVGGGLTRRAEVNARARLGQLLLAQGLVTAAQLEQSLESAKANGNKLGEAFVELGFLTSEQLTSILEEQKRSHVGLMEALNGAAVKDCVTSGGVEGLDILPLGTANAHDAATLSPLEIKSVIDEAKAVYDTILIDTGPVPGSLEASMVSSLTDGVLLVVARGEHRASAEGSIEHLRRIGGRVAGLVFNRAKAADASLIGGSLYHTSQSSRPSSRPPVVATRQAASERFGPVGQAVLDLSPVMAN